MKTEGNARHDITVERKSKSLDTFPPQNTAGDQFVHFELNVVTVEAKEKTKSYSSLRPTLYVKCHESTSDVNWCKYI